MRGHFISALLLLIASSASRGQADSAEARSLLKDYIERHNSHDLEGVMALYADEAVFYLSMGRPPVHGRDAIMELERFDVAAQSTIYPQQVSFEQDGDLWRIHIDGAIEHSEIFEAAGVSIVMAQGIQDAFVLRDGRIVEINQPDLQPACTATVLEAFRGSVAWLHETNDGRQQLLVENGFIKLTPKTIPDVISLLREWRRKTNTMPDAATMSACATFAP
jgi:hypothetical protein